MNALRDHLPQSPHHLTFTIVAFAPPPLHYLPFPSPPLPSPHNSPAGVEFTHANQHPENEDCDLGLVHEGGPRCHGVPLELADLTQWFPPVHALCPTSRLLHYGALLVEVLHLRGRGRGGVCEVMGGSPMAGGRGSLLTSWKLKGPTLSLSRVM